jgi:hypothetical protein
MKQIDLVVGQITDLNTDRLVGWSAYYRSEAEVERLRKIISRLKKRLKHRAKSINRR